MVAKNIDMHAGHACRILLEVLHIYESTYVKLQKKIHTHLFVDWDQRVSVRMHCASAPGYVRSGRKKFVQT